MSDQLENYREKRRQLVNQEEIVDDFVSLLDIVAGQLKNFWDMMALPDEIGKESSPQQFGAGTPMDVDKWPSYQEFIDAVVLWKSCRKDAEQAWEALSDLEREQNDPLPELPSERTPPKQPVRYVKRPRRPIRPGPHRR
jgi:hypothetical protein